MNQVISDIELTGKDELELESLVSQIAAELAQIRTNSPKFRVKEASLCTVRSALSTVRNHRQGRPR